MSRCGAGLSFPAWYLLLATVLGILSGCQNLRDLEGFAIRYHAVLSDALDMELRLPPSDSSFRYFGTPEKANRLLDPVARAGYSQIKRTGYPVENDSYVSSCQMSLGSIQRQPVHCKVHNQE